MSRIGSRPINVPDGVQVDLDNRDVTVAGPKGTLNHKLVEPITISKTDDGTLEVTRGVDNDWGRSMQGLSRTLVANMVTGVSEGFTKTLEIVGVGYRVQARGSDTVELSLGYSHPITIKAPEVITFQVESATRFSVQGIDKQLVGEIAARIRRLRKPDPYKGKGVRYQGERIRRKVGKAGK